VRSYIEDVTLSRPLAWSLLLLTLVGSSLIRQLHVFVPEWGPLSWPDRSPLYAALVLFFILLLAAPLEGRPQRSALQGRRLLAAALAPLLVALVYEKILSITLYDALLEHALRWAPIRNHLDAWIHVVIGTGMTIAVLLLVPLMRGVRFADFGGRRLLGSAVSLQLGALGLSYMLVAALALMLGGLAARPSLVVPAFGGALALMAGHIVRAMAEEFYYRGLLQRELSSLGSALGVRSDRNAQALGVALVALGFGLEHFNFGEPLAASYRGFAYAVAVGFLFGYLLIWSGNVLFCGLVHATHNLATAGLLPRLTTADGDLLLSPDAMIYVYLIATFLAVFAAQAWGALGSGSGNHPGEQVPGLPQAVDQSP